MHGSGQSLDLETKGDVLSQVSLETEGEWQEVRRRMEAVKAPFIWTSGHICDKYETIPYRT